LADWCARLVSRFVARDNPAAVDANQQPCVATIGAVIDRITGPLP
jgi:hypothetical protein